MLIDWFTVAAQAVNFLILMWLLKRFLYKPILNAIDAREARIAETVKKAEDQEKAAEAEHADFIRKNEALDLERVHLLTLAQEEAKAAGKHLLERERKVADAAREKWRNSLADEQRRFGDEVVRRVREETFGILRNAFSELADTSLESRMIEVFGRKLRESKDAVAAELGASEGGARTFVVKSAFELDEERRGELRKLLAEIFGAGAEPRFQIDPNLRGGVELVVDGRKIAWSLEDYLERLEGSVAELVDAPAGAAVPSPSPVPDGSDDGSPDGRAGGKTVVLQPGSLAGRV